ncbi:hypothetical protein HHA04nite_11030 [Halomonas halophila]|uniref:Uncharacterized protein n=1 Tax=Halomonas halophila TaxID=29573 RepID=A0ABQ0U6C7_9GAMM|nr:hypothetical protein HHA04nite_11030 [Halomonas halophila]
MFVGDKTKRGSYAKGEEHSSERAGHGWPAQALQAAQDAKAPQGVGSTQGRVYSALAGLGAGRASFLQATLIITARRSP